MASVQSWLKPDLRDRPGLMKLNDELHDLRLDAGLPSARTIRNRIGKDAQEYWIVNHQAVLNTFQRPDLPRWGRLELIVAVLSEDAGHSDAEREVSRFKNLWKQAFDETVAQASVQPPAEAAASHDETKDSAQPHEGQPEQGIGDDHQQTEQDPSADSEAPVDADQASARINYAEESLKGLIINAAQALWDDKDALRIFLGVVRRGEGFVRLADAVAERRPANATFYGVKSREFEVEPSPARHELVSLRRFLHEHRIKRQWSFTNLETQTGVSSDDWIRWYTRDELPRRQAVVAFSHVAHLGLEDHVLLLGLWEAAHEALQAQRHFEALPARISFDEAWLMRDATTPRLWALAGVAAEEQHAYGPDLATGTAPAFVVAGPPGSGRSTALVNVARALLAASTRVVLAAPKASPLRELDGQHGVVACFVREDIGSDELEAVLASASPEEPVVVVIDDVEALHKCDAGGLLKGLVQHGFEEGTALVVGCCEDKLPFGFGWLEETKKAHRGLLLSPQEQSTGDVIGIRIGHSIAGQPITLGRGWLHLGDGELLPVVVPG
ncbi:AAA family ATPase [Streptomyces telluris]|uniref:AAA family ATPase n=1 Tax=Streptomyces telluris TaxID=2720021 RepID=A0A9X2LMM9_9ACTN|nr:AAA family ATPase [Streptomyces telluris]MCQ8774038.1 AAA family ATPase [Streptomyces telluris]NJP80142.1 ATP-binding protein [Streptomyces telluris]